MERYTMRADGGVVMRCNSCPGNGQGLCSWKTCRNRLKDLACAYEDAMPLERAQELAQAEKKGRLVVLPCKVGDTIYKVVKCCGKQSGFCFHASCDQSHDQCQYWIAAVVEEKVEDVWDMSEVIQHLGETIFLTRQEAEAAKDNFNKTTKGERLK